MMKSQIYRKHAIPSVCTLPVYALPVWVLSVSMLSLISVLAHAEDDQFSSPIAASIQQAESSYGQPMFGEQLFQGHFSSMSGATFGDDYVIKAGDSVQIRMWGAYQHTATVIVDPQGYISLPYVKPFKVAGIKNRDLYKVVRRAVDDAYRSHVSVYASLEEAQPVKVYVTGFVKQPGYYGGLASDSVLAYLDRAGGVDPQRGSYIDIKIRRDNELAQQINLYEFILAGQLPTFAFREGDVVVVSPQQKTFEVKGAVRNEYTFEYSVPNLTVADVLTIANPRADASDFSITRLKDGKTQTYPLVQAADVAVNNGDSIFVKATIKADTISADVLQTE